MKFKTIAEAYNFYKTQTAEQIETRAAEIKNIIETDAKADVAALNIEAEGMEKAMTEKRSQEPDGSQGVEFRGFTFLTGSNMGTEGSQEAVKGDVFASAEYRSAFYKNLMGKALTAAEKAAFARGVEMRAGAFNTMTTSAAVIPTNTLNEVVKKAHTIGGLMNEVRAFAMPSKIAVPVGTPGSKAAWHVEGKAVDSEKVDTASVIFDGNEIIKVFSMSAATNTMSIDAFEAYLVDELTTCVMECIADALVNGTGSGQGTGIESGISWTDDTNAVKVAKGGAIKYADVVKTVAMLKRGYANGAKWAMNNATLYNTFYGMTDANGRPIFIADPKSESVGKILGFDIVIDDNIADNVAYFGNFYYMGYNMPQGIVIETSRESSFKSGLIDYRALAIADCKPVVKEAFVKLYIATE